MDAPTINNFTQSEQHFTAEDRKAIYRLEFNNENVQKDIKEMKGDIKEIKEGVSARVTALELVNVSVIATIKSNDDASIKRYQENRDIVTDHERRIRWAERIAYVGITILAGVQFYLSYIKH